MGPTHPPKILEEQLLQNNAFATPLAYCINLIQTFKKSYYERDYCEPMLSKNVFQTYVPIVVVDLSRQNDNVKTLTIDLRVEFETDTVIPEKTTAYCLILHDQIITFNSFSSDVRKL
ncbi:Uncharacterized protein FWK35_00022801 [Aphis craccivora]|uniref:Double jelly roll-like domain-containing protein n=1 Tax=Aphis craccivora TaxID=307492 RepID=A0A6G0W102_APHCR|nr:Uncharacterized protein FWK35_00022801 [Aphis craccivora]